MKSGNVLILKMLTCTTNVHIAHTSAACLPIHRETCRQPSRSFQAAIARHSGRQAGRQHVQLFSEMRKGLRAIVITTNIIIVLRYGECMSANRLKLNKNKTKYMWLGSQQRLQNVDDPNEPVVDPGVLLAPGLLMGDYVEGTETKRSVFSKNVSQDYMADKRSGSRRKTLNRRKSDEDYEADTNEQKMMKRKLKSFFLTRQLNAICDPAGLQLVHNSS
ncbi:hypothetical protein HELRODRAFT_162563 [Helobdella robusta]|uniref:Uncharacterized protein n=1 Tax=Helobdella robusta TaxID=6412 RepID=T1ESU4_HELRO|nr:hypothetical protein HELRODRAFT_162563 [Helobdella robusta]ESN99080.1 hypothetical protein HELRODRAFT_162563 [Helobdella robusta]